MATPTIPAGQYAEQDLESRWHALQERCIAITGKAFSDLDADETMRVVNLLSTDDRAFALRYLEQFCSAKAEPKSPTPAKLRGPRKPREERMTLPEAFALGDDRDDERAVRSAALLLDWASEVGNAKVDGMLAMGISQALLLVAKQMERTRRRLERERLEVR
jgi:hypothetical protein